MFSRGKLAGEHVPSSRMALLRWFGLTEVDEPRKVCGADSDSSPSLFTESILLRLIAMCAFFGAGALLLGFSPPAHAVEATFVSNDGQSSDYEVNIGNRKYAQGFETGDTSGGYDLTSVEVNLSDAGDQDLTVQVREARFISGVPAPATSALYTLTPPTTLGTGLQKFTAPGNATLDPNTQYFVVVAPGSFDPTDVAEWRATHSSAEDDSGARDWRIHERRLILFSNGWDDTSGVHKIRINAENTAPTSGDAEVATHKNENYGFRKNDFEFDDDDDHRLDHISITSLPGKGTLSLYTVDITVTPLEVTVAELNEGKLRYNPPTDASTPNDIFTTFEFKVSDGYEDSASAYTFTMKNEGPTIVGPDEISVEERTSTDQEIGSYPITVPSGYVATWEVSRNDADDFSVLHTTSAGGQQALSVAFENKPDAEEPDDDDADNVYKIRLEVTANSLTDSLDVTVTVTDKNEFDPTVTGSAAIDYAENGTDVIGTYTIDDRDFSAVAQDFVLDLTGDDADQFTLERTDNDDGTVTAELNFNAPPDYEAPGDSDSDNDYEVTVSVSDGSKTGDLDITVTVTDQNDAPTADAGGDRTVAEGAEVTLDGSDSSDPEGADLTYAWTQTAPDSGLGSAVTLSDETTASPGFTAPTELLENLTLTFSLTVNDGTQDSTADTVDITVTAGDNDAPTADAGDDRTVDEGDAVTLDGSASSDPEGADLTYAWTQTAPDSGPGSAVTLSDATTASPGFTAPTELLDNLTLTFSLTVGDGVNTSDAATVDITVTAGDNDAPTAHAGGDRTVAEGAEVTLDGSDSSDPEGADLTYAWTQTAPDSGLGSAVTLSDETTASPGFTAPTELLENLTLTFSLTVNDGTQDSTADTVDITVTAGDNDAPTADAGDDRTVDEGDAVTLDGSASSDPEGADLTYAWTQTAPDSGPGSAVTLSDATTASPGFTAPTELLDNLTLTFSLTVGDGVNTSDAATVDITVTAGDNDAPTADAGDDRTVAEGAAVTLDGSDSSDPESADLTYVWTQTAPDSGLGSAVTLSDETTASPSFTAPDLLATTTLTFSLTVGDGVNTSTADTVDINVTADNDAPTAHAGGDRTVGEGAEVTLDGSASSDPEGADLTYAWTQTAPDSGEGSAVTLSDATTASPSFTAPTELLENLTLTFSLTVNDGTQDSTADTVDISVEAGTNDSPTAQAGADQTVSEGDAVTLDGSASSDPEGADLTYVWTQTAPDSGPGSAVTLSDETTASPGFTAPTELLENLTLTFSLTVGDGVNTSDAATVDITVTAGDNDAPTADAGDDRTVAEGAAVTLDGSDSSDPESADLTYAWTQTAPDSGPGSAVTLSDGTTASPGFTAPDLLATTTLTFSLTVGDGVNTSTADTVDINVTADNDAPTAHAGGDQTVGEGAEVTLDGSASSDPEGAALTYAWTQTAPDSGPGSGVTLDTTDPDKPTFTAPTELLENLTLTFSLTVDDGVNTSTADTVDITVIAVPAAPAGLAATAGDGGVALAWDDPGNDTINKYQVSTNGGTSFADIVGSDKNTTEHTITGLDNGTEYTFALRAVNDSGPGAVSTVSATPEERTRQPEENNAPTAHAGDDQTVAEGDAVILDGSASSDPEGADLTYVWTQTAPDSGEGSAVTLDTTEPDKPTFTAPDLSATTTLTFSLTVNDGTRDSTADTVDITVTADNDAPTAVAGGDQTVAEGAAVTLDGSASSDPEGADLTYVWTQTAPDSGEGSAVTLDTTDPDKPTFTAPDLSATTTLTFSLTVNDGTQDSTADTVDITVTADNEAPTAHAGGDQTVDEGDAVALDGSASSDPEGAALTYDWTQTAPDSGEGSAVTLDTTEPDKPTFTVPELSATTTLTFSLTVNDGTQDSTADTVDITVTADNDAPTAHAGGDQTVGEGAEVTLDGSASSDPEGTALTYAWTQTAPDSGLGSAVPLDTTDPDKPTFTAPTELLENLALTFSLTVGDGVNTSAADTVDITVTAGTNDAPTADAGADQTVSEGDTVTLDGSASSDPEGTALTYAWTQTAPDSGLGSAVPLSDETTASPSFTAPDLLATTTLTFSLTVGDGVNTSTADTVDITVTADNDAPTAHAGGDQTVDERDTVTLNGSASSDPEGTALTYAWTQSAPASGLGSAVPLSDATTASPSFTAPTELLENLTLTFVLTVNDGTQDSTPDTVDITVTAGDNDAPSADAGGDQTVDERDTVTLNGSASSDPEGTALTYAWTQSAPASGLGSAVPLSEATTASPSFTAPTELLENLTLTFSLTVSDGVNTSAADTVDITVTAGDNDAPTAYAGGDQTVDEGDAVTLDGSASSDPEGATLTYAWTQTAPASGLGSAVPLSDATTASPGFTAPTELLENLTLTFSLTVSDGVNTSTADTVDITVTAGTKDITVIVAPAAPAGLTATAGDAQVSLSWTDPGNNTINKYQVSMNGGMSFADIVGSNKNTTEHTITGLDNGTEYTFALRAVNDSGPGAVSTVSATPEERTRQPEENNAPTAHAGGDQTVDEGDAVILDGSDSSDPEGAALTYVWTQTAPDSGLGSAVTLSEATTASPSFTAPTELLENLTLTFSLTVSDGVNTSAADTVDITVTAGDNDAPTAYAGGDQTVDEGDAVTLDGSASSDPEGATLTYAWTQTAPASGLGSAVPLSDATTASPGFTAPTELLENLTLTFSLTVSDGVNTSTADTVDITVTAGTKDITVIVAPAAPAGLTATAGDAQVSLSWTDPGNNTINKYQVSMNGGMSFADIVGSNKNTTEHTITGLDNGTEYTFALRAVNDSGPGAVSTVSATPEERTRQPEENNAPTAHAGGDQTVDEGDAVILDGSDSSDPEGAALTYVWTQTAPDSGLGSAVTLSEATTASPSFTAPTELLENLTLTFSLTVSDGVNTSAADTVDITVTAGSATAPPAAPDNFTATAGDARVTLTWDAADDASIERWEYRQWEGALDWGDWTAIADSGADTTAHAVEPLVNGTEYSFQVRAVNATGDGAASEERTATPQARNKPPTVAAPFDDLALVESATVEIDLSPVFEDQDGDALTYTAAADDAAVLTAMVSGSTLRLIGGAPGTATVTVTASDREGSASHAFAVTVEADTQPSLTTIADQTYTVGVAITTLTLPAASSGNGELAYSLSPDLPAGLVFDPAMRTLSGIPGAAQAATDYAYVAKDADGDTAILSFSITVEEPASPPLELQVRFEQANYTVMEGGQADIRVMLSPAADRRVDVPLAVALLGRTTSEDFGGVPASLVFESGDSVSTISLKVFLDDVNDPGEGIVLSFARTPEAVNAGEPDSTQVDFMQQQTAEQGSKSQEATLALVALSTAAIAQQAIQGRFERFRNSNRPETSVEELPPEESDHGAEAPLPGEPEPTSLEGAADTPQSGRNSADQETGTPGRWLRNVALGALGSAAGFDLHSSGSSVDSAVEPGGSTPGQDRHNGSRIGAPLSDDTLVPRDILPNLSGLSFEAPLRRRENLTNWAPVLWVQHDLQQFNGDLRQPGLVYRGGLEAAHLGLDLYASDRVLAGLSFMRSWGDLEYSEDGADGVLEGRMDTVHPYLYWQPNEKLSMWGIGGLGGGQVSFEETGRTHDIDADFRMLAGGVRWMLSSRGHSEWGVRTDAFTAQLGTGATEDMANASGEVRRGRLMLEWVYDRELSAGRLLSLRTEAGGRIDDGDANRGAGMETGFRLGYLDANRGLELALHGRVLAVHESDYRDWGVGLQASWDPGEKQRGFRSSFTSSWGLDGGGRTTVWENADAVTSPARIAATGNGLPYQFGTELAYAGLTAPGLPGLLTPYTRISWTRHGRELAVGTTWSLSDTLPAMSELGISMRENQTGPAEFGVFLRVSIPLGGM